MNNNSLNVLVFIILLGTLLGCSGVRTFPYSVQSGETIAVAVGSPDGMSRSNTTATFTSDSIPSSPLDITSNIQAIFQLYPDKKSELYNSGSQTSNIPRTSGHEASLTVAAINLPSGLPIGPGKIQFTTTASYPAIGSHINNWPIGINILPPTSSSTPPLTPDPLTYEYGLGAFQNGNITNLEPGHHVQIRPDFTETSNGWPTYAAIEIKLGLPVNITGVLDKRFARVTVDDMTPETNSGRDYIAGIKNDELTLMLFSLSEALEFYEARFSVTLLPPFTFTQNPVINSIKYFDINGAQVTGPLDTTFASQIYIPAP